MASPISISWDSNGYVAIYTEKLYMRPVQESDLPKSIELYGDPETVALFDDGKPKSAEKVSELVQKIGVKYFSRETPYGLFSVFKRDSKEFLGHFDFLPEGGSSESKRFEIGYIIHKKEHGKGYGNEIGLGIKQYAQELNLKGHKIEYLTATADPNNIPSWKVLEKMGMIFLRQETRVEFNRERKFYEIKLLG